MVPVTAPAVSVVLAIDPEKLPVATAVEVPRLVLYAQMPPPTRPRLPARTVQLLLYASTLDVLAIMMHGLTSPVLGPQPEIVLLKTRTPEEISRAIPPPRLFLIRL